MKLDNLQPSGSFKLRGVGNYIAKNHVNAPDPDAVHFFSSSGGNAGLACVYAAKTVGRPATVVVPLTTPDYMIERIRDAGAENVVQHGATWKEADIHLREVVMKDFESLGGGRKAVYAPPFDHELVWEGNSTLIDEVQEDMLGMGLQEPPSTVVCSVGGGGLFSGTMAGIARQSGWEQTSVVAVETEGANSLAQSLEAGQPVTIPGITSKATSLGSVRPCNRAFELAHDGFKKGRVKSAVLSDDEAAMGCWELADAHRMLVELACGVNVALCFDERLERVLDRKIDKDETIVLVVCGGCLVDAEMVAGWKKRLDGTSLNGRPRR